MASFDFFTQPQGPVIPISLFGDAARGGTEVGNAIPTGLTAAIQGGIKGYQIGQQIEANNLQNELRANQVQQLPVQNDIQQAQLESIRLRNQQGQLQTDLEAKTQNNRLDATNAQLKDNIVRFDQDRIIRQNADNFTNTFKNADPQQQAQMVLGGQYSDVFAKDPNLYKQSLQSIYLNPRSNLDPTTKANIGAFFQKSNIKDAYQRAADANLGQYQKSEAELLNDPLTGQLIQGTGLSAKQTYGNIKFVDSGQYETGSDGKRVLIDPATGEPLQKPGFTRGGEKPITGFDVIFKDPDTGEYSLLAKGVDKDQKKLFDTWIGQKAIQDGSSMRSDLAQIDKEAQVVKDKLNQQSINGAPQPGNISTFGASPSSLQGEKIAPMRVQIAAKTLGLPQEDALKLDPTLKSLEDHLIQETMDPEYRNSVGANFKKNALYETIGRTYASDQLKNSPALQAQYNQGAVDKYNKATYDTAYNTLYNVNAAVATPENIKMKIGPFLADNPTDYYYKKNLPAINQSLKYLTNQYTELAKKKVQASVKKVTSTQRIMQDLAGTANGG